MKIPVVGVVMAGGSGERFWPVSRQQNPKQLLRFTHPHQTLLDEAIDRLLPLMPPERMFIATNALLRDLIKSALPHFPPENVIGEPIRRSTAGCLVLAAAQALARLPEEEDMVMVVTTADHRIGKPEMFRQTLEDSIAFAWEHESLGVLGVIPTRPETGYGYMEIDGGASPHATPHGFSIYPVKRFCEKPNRDTAEHFLATGRFYWNSGMFIWKISAFLQTLDQTTPELSEAVRSITQALHEPDGGEAKIRAIFQDLPDISIDYALLEKAGNVSMTLCDLDWDDVGAWDALRRIEPMDKRGNVAVGNPILVDCQNILVFNEPGLEEMAVGVIGMKDVCVITSRDGILVCSSDRVQEVRQIVEALKNRNAKQV